MRVGLWKVRDDMTKSCDVIIVGTGAAGLFCALNLPADKRIQIITKRGADESDSFLAQGGICMLRGEEDYADYFEDTLRAGHYENDKHTVDIMIRSSNSVIRELIAMGTDFDKDAEGKLAFTKEGAHSQPRILFHEDVTGREITSTLLKRAMEKENITICEYTTMLDLVVKEGVCGGIVAQKDGEEPFIIAAPNVVLACGGIGGIYNNSTNFAHITGDALAISVKHGIELEHLDYIQIHPTTLYTKKKGRRFLISESVRGEGAYLLNKDMQRFTDELQPRDVVSEAIWDQMHKDNTKHVWEDMRPIGAETILAHFPNIYQHCLKEGYDVLKEPIPVVPAQHYHMGGIRVDLGSRTSMPGVYAVGEASCNGVHGKNRLASNSLLESLVFAQRAADDIHYKTSRQTVEITEADVDMSQYADAETLFADYRQMVFDTINEHEKLTKEGRVEQWMKSR